MQTSSPSMSHARLLLLSRSLANWRPVGHVVLCSLLLCMRDMNASTSISVVAAPKGTQSLCSTAGQSNTNSEVLWLCRTSWLCVFMLFFFFCFFLLELCGLQRSSAPHLKQSVNCSLFAGRSLFFIQKRQRRGLFLFSWLKTLNVLFIPVWFWSPHFLMCQSVYRIATDRENIPRISLRLCRRNYPVRSFKATTVYL